MKTASLLATAMALAIVPPLASVGCNRRDDATPLPAVVQSASPPPAVTATGAAPVVQAPVPAAPVAAAPVQARPVTRGDAGARDSAVAAAAFDASTVAFPTFPALHPSALPAIASGIVGGIIAAFPSGIVPPPPAPSK